MSSSSLSLSPTSARPRDAQHHLFEAMRRYLEAEKWQVDLIAERKRQLDAGEIGYASPERVAAVLNKYAVYDDGQ